MIHTAAAGIVGFGSARSRTIRFDCADNGGALISVHNCLPALNGAGSIFNWMPAKCQLHRRGSQIEPASLNNRRRPDTMAGAPGPIGPVPLSHATLVPPCSPSIDKARPCVVFKKSNKKVPYESCEIPCESRIFDPLRNDYMYLVRWLFVDVWTCNNTRAWAGSRNSKFRCPTSLLATRFAFFPFRRCGNLEFYDPWSHRLLELLFYACWRIWLNKWINDESNQEWIRRIGAVHDDTWSQVNVRIENPVERWCVQTRRKGKRVFDHATNVISKYTRRAGRAGGRADV